MALIRKGSRRWTLPADLAVKLEGVDQRSRSNTHRIEDLEKDHQALNRLATAEEVMATKQDSMSDSMDRLTGKVQALEAKPAKRWDGIVDKLIWAVLPLGWGFCWHRLGLHEKSPHHSEGPGGGGKSVLWDMS